jgi:hypothetical protein
VARRDDRTQARERINKIKGTPGAATMPRLALAATVRTGALAGLLDKIRA